jgi:hypothetical protein
MATAIDNRRWTRAAWLWLAWWLLAAAALGVGCVQVATGIGRGTETLLITFAVALASFPLWVRWRGERKRSASLARFCARYQLSYRESCPTDAVTAFSGLPIFQRGEPASVRNWMEGTLAGQSVVVVDYASSNNVSLAGKDMATRNAQTVVVFTEAGGLPDFQMVPRLSVWNRPIDEEADDFEEQAFVDIDFPGEDVPEFDKRYRVGGTEVYAVRAVFTPAARALLAGTKNWIVEARDGQLALYQRARCWPPKDLPRLLERAADIARRLIVGDDFSS